MRQGIYGVSRTRLGEGAVQCNIIKKQPRNFLWQKEELFLQIASQLEALWGGQRKQCSWCVQLVDQNKAENGTVREEARGAVRMIPEKP